MAERITGTLADLAHAEPNTDVITKAASNLAPGQHSDKITTMLGALTKGATPGVTDDRTVATEGLFRNAITKGFNQPVEVAKGLSPQFGGALNAAIAAANPMSRMVEELNTQLGAALGKNISLTSPLSSGLVPFNLEAPAKHIYPVNSPLRNRIPRVQGQGITHMAKIISAISGSLPGGLGSTARMSIPELPAGGGLGGSNWPNQIPGSGSQTMYDISVPYKFFGLTESVSWLAQFAGQGFEDAAGLASLILLQEAMQLEERAIIGATSVALSTPAAPGGANRAANTGEVGLSGVTTNVYVAVTALNYYGETAASPITTIAGASGVDDVTIVPVSGALAYNIYVATGASAPAIGTFSLMASAVGATKYTLQGALATGTPHPPASDTGTSANTDYEGMISAISGHSAGTVYPAGIKGSYVNQSVNDTLSVNAINNALLAMWNGTNGIFADPDELVAEGSDLTRLGASMANAGTGTAGYRFEVSQSEVANLRVGGSVREFVHPVTQKIIKLTPHPFLPQGTAMLASWTLPSPVQTVSNVWENVMVQDYLSISWPVIDVTFRYSLFFYGNLWSPAVQYNGLLQGIQKTVATAGSGTNS